VRDQTRAERPAGKMGLWTKTTKEMFRAVTKNPGREKKKKG